MKEQTKKTLFKIVFTLIIGFGFAFFTAAKVYDVTAFGAVGDAKTLDSDAIQQAIDECASDGGGTVVFPSGSYLTGTIYLDNNIHLYLENGATLMLTTDTTQFPRQTARMKSLRSSFHCMIYAERKSNIMISGNGTIEGQGNKEPYQILHKDQNKRIVRPKVICMVECKNIRVRDITLLNSPSWMQNYLACEDLVIDGITVSNRRSSVNNDGIDIDCCRNVRISNCNIDSEDDCIVLKSTSNRLCENVTITNCVLSSHCNAFKCGTESNGGFHNITVSNCVIYNTYLSGIALEIVDGGDMDLIAINNIVMHHVNNPLFIKLGNRARPYSEDKPVKGKGRMKNIQINNIQADRVGGFVETPDIEFSHHNAKPDAAAIFITGLNEENIENVTLTNFRINYEGGGKKEYAAVEVPENEKTYPEYSSYGSIRPAYGFYCRNVSDITLENIHLTFEKSDFRPAYIFDKVKQLYADNISGDKAEGGDSMIKLTQCKDAILKLNPLLVQKDDIGTENSVNLIFD